MKFVYLSDGPLQQTTGGEIGIFAKSMSGLAEYARRWPGQVVVSSLEPPVVTEKGPQYLWADDEIARQLTFVPLVDAAALEAMEAVVVMHSVLGPRSESLLGRDFKVILTDDWSPEVRLEVGLVTNRGLVDRARIRAGALRRTRRLDALGARADGFQCNGHSAFEHYRSVNDSTHMFFDHRMRAEDIELGVGRPYWGGDRSLRIAYSGRLTEIKGVRLIVPFLEQLEERGVDFEFTVIGNGNLEAELRSRASERLRFAGFMDFETDWKRYVREEVDLMFLPHVQGDSASTYFEAMGSGVPVLGFENRTLTPLLAAGGGGWAVANPDVAAAAEVVTALIADPSALEIQGRRGAEFLSRIPFERMFDGRVRHFIETAAR